MTTYQTFAVTVNGIDYSVDVSTKNNRDAFLVTTNNGKTVITNQWGDWCNPLRGLWSDRKYQSVHGAARHAMELKCIRNAVEDEVNAHKDFCLDEIAA